MLFLEGSQSISHGIPTDIERLKVKIELSESVNL
jgi:hypothetical protein